jgi:hypothetical protein
LKVLLLIAKVVLHALERLILTRSQTSMSSSRKMVWVFTTTSPCGGLFMSPHLLRAGYNHTSNTSTVAVSFALAAHRPCREVGSCLISSATHNGDDQYIDATWLRWVIFNQVANLPTPPQDGCARQGSVPLPVTAIVDPTTCSRQCGLQSSLIERWAPAVLFPALDIAVQQSPRHPPKESRDSPVAIHRLSITQTRRDPGYPDTDQSIDHRIIFRNY